MSLRSFLLAAACCAWSVNASASDMIVDWMTKGTILVCKANQCVQTNHNMNREYLNNQIQALMEANNGQSIDVCEGDAETRQCVRKGISFPVQSPVIQTNVSISKARLVEERSVKDVPGIDLIMDYKVRAGDTFPRCQTALSRIGTVHAGSSEIMSPRFNCKLTETGNTTFSLAYHIDYIDFDQGIIGALYTAAANNVLQGAGSGYVLFDFAKGVQMEPTETFPYPEQLAALQSGEVATFDTPADIEAVWMKPTPFLNWIMPEFAPNECHTFEGGCSAQMLNNPEMALPSAKEKIAALTPAGVASTTGLIQQKVTFESVSPAEQTTVKTKQVIMENGKTVYTENQTRHYVRETKEAPLVEDKSKAETTISGTKPIPLEEVVQNAQKEYAAMKQFESKTPETSGAVIVSAPAAQQQIVPQVQAGAAAPQSTGVPRSITQPAAGANTPQKGLPMTETNVEILVPEGAVLTDAERAYIEQLALPPEVMEAQKQQKEAQVIASQSQVNTTGSVQKQTPSVAQVPAQQMPIEAGMPVAQVGAQSVQPVAEQQQIVITPNEQPVKEKQKSFWGGIKEKMDKYIYF